MHTLQWAQFRQRQRLRKVFLGIRSPAMTPVTLSSISPRHMHHLAEGFLPLSDAYQLKLTLLLIATEDPQIFGSFTKIWYYLLLVLSFGLCHCSFLGEVNYWRWSKKVLSQGLQCLLARLMRLKGKNPAAKSHIQNPFRYLWNMLPGLQLVLSKGQKSPPGPEYFCLSCYPWAPRMPYLC